MRTTRTPRLLTVAATVGLAVCLAPLAAANAATATASRTLTAKTTKAATMTGKTSFVKVRPWTSKGTLRVRATVQRAPAASTCGSSNLTDRQGLFRCHLGNEVVDPAFKSPTSNRIAVQRGSRWVVYTKVSTFNPGPAGKAQVFQVKLTNGAVCSASSGAGPAPIKKFPYWVGQCTGGPYGKAGATWRATLDDGKNAHYPLLALNARHTKWAVPVESPAGIVKMVPVRTAYR